MIGSVQGFFPVGFSDAGETSFELKRPLSIELNRIMLGTSWKTIISAPKPRKAIQSQPFSSALALVPAKAEAAIMRSIPAVVLMIDFMVASLYFFLLRALFHKSRERAIDIKKLNTSGKWLIILVILRRV